MKRSSKLKVSAECAEANSTAVSEDGLREACGVMACVLAEGTPASSLNVATTICLGLVALQHR